TMACAPEPQTRLTVSAGIVTGNPAWTAACRAGFILVPACTTLPMTTVSASSGWIPARTTAAPIATAPKLGAGTSLRLPPKVPIAVRTGSANTTDRCDVMAKPPELGSMRFCIVLTYKCVHTYYMDAIRVYNLSQNCRLLSIRYKC